MPVSLAGWSFTHHITLGPRYASPLPVVICRTKSYSSISELPVCRVPTPRCNIVNTPAGAMLWIDKYAPRTIAGLDCHREINEVFTQLCKSSDIPHLILYGPSGSGKKARIMVLLREIFGAKADHIKVETLTDKNTNTEITVSQSQCHTNIMCNDLGTRDRVIVQNIIRSLCASSFTSSFFSKGPTFRGEAPQI